MKQTNFFLAVVLLLTLFSIGSCEVEPLDPVLGDPNNNVNNGGTTGTNGNTNNGTGNSIFGTYIMTAVNTSVPTDLNGDSIESTNQMNETSCFNNNNIILNSNNTFSSTSKGVDIDLTTIPGTIECYEDPIVSGTWSISGDRISLSYFLGSELFVDEFIINGNTLTLTALDGQIVGTTSTGEPVELDGDINFIYTKQ